MKFLILLLVCISGIIISNINYVLFGITLLIISIYLIIRHYKYNKIFIFISLTLFILFLIYGIIDFHTLQKSNEFVGIVIKKKENYVVVFDGLERFYVPTFGNYEFSLFDVIKINGTFDNINFHSIESEFSFKDYLNKQGINRQIHIYSYTHIFNIPIDCSLLKDKILSIIFTDKSKEIVNTIFLDNIEYGSELESSLSNNAILYIFSISGVYFNFFINKLNGLLKNYLKEWKANIVSTIILVPLFILNINSFIVKRLLIYYPTKLVCKKIFKLDAISISSLSYLLLLINKYNVYEFGFIMPLIISTFLQLTKLLFKRKRRYIKKFCPLVLIFVIVLPFTISFNNFFNPLTMLISFFLTPFIRLLIILMYPLFFLVKLPFLENILDFTYDLLVSINIKFLNINVPKFNQIEIIFYYMVIVLFLYFLEVGFKKMYKYFALIYTCFIITYSLPIYNSFSNGVYFINVGQGDATLIRIKNKNILVDTGGSLYKDIAQESLIPFFRKNRIYKLDAVFITHYDTDHYFALESLKKNFTVKNIYDYNNFYEYNNSIITIYNLNNNYYEYVEENSRSLVLRFEINSKKFLLMGDSPIEVEKQILKQYKNLNCDILKVGHHGSKGSTSLEFLKAITPSEAIISCGIDNSYGHPDNKVVQRLNSLNIKIRRTDIEGTIEYKV